MAGEAGAQPGSQRASHPYHMHDAIREQPDRIAQWLRTEREGAERAADAAASRKRLVLVGIGTSYHAAQVGEHFVRHLTGGRERALVEQSFELVHYPLGLTAEDALIAISHRGWKNYSVQALQAARAAGALTIVVTGHEPGVGMTVADFVIPTCEQEISSAPHRSAGRGVLLGEPQARPARRAPLCSSSCARASAGSSSAPAPTGPPHARAP